MAAVSNGADAVYFGVVAPFNARLQADKIQLIELPEIMAWLHARGVKGFLTVSPGSRCLAVPNGFSKDWNQSFQD